MLDSSVSLEAFRAPTVTRRRPRWPLIVFLAALTVAVVLPFPLVRGASGDGVVLPTRVYGYAPLTADVRDEPAGPALLAFYSGDDEMYAAQRLVLGADGRSYRTLGSSNATNPPDPDYLGAGFLSPDGTAMLFVDSVRATSELRRLDLRTGTIRPIPLPTTEATAILAWSPDGRYVAYGHAPIVADSTSRPDQTPAEAVRQKGRLSLLDLASSSIVDMSGLGVAYAAAFAPGSDAMAVQAGDRVLVVDPTGRVQREIPRPREDLGVLPDVGWSPDGRWLALVTYQFSVYGGVATVGPHGSWASRRAVTFVDAAGTGSTRGPFDLGDYVLGWRDAQTLVQFHAWTFTLSGLSVSDGHAEPLATITAGNVCDLPFAQCTVYDLSAATGLLRTARLESPAWPVRGRLVVGAQLVALVLAAGALFLLVRGLARVVARRRRAPSPAPVGSDALT